jgi:Dolichyl-phosphate-mannose-protein mannosyltransferase
MPKRSEIAVANTSPQGRYAQATGETRQIQLFSTLIALSALYAGLAFVAARRFVWYDELLTYYIARAPTFHTLIEWLLKPFDLQPSPTYLLSRLSMSLFGDNQYALRLPSIVEFYLASGFLFFFVRRKARDVYAGLAVLILWCSPMFRYATEARPYALLFMFFSSLLLCYDIATGSNRRSLATWGVAVSCLGMILAHAFAIFSILPFIAAEAMRFLRRRMADYALAAAILLPTLGMITYIPITHRAFGVLFPTQFQASLKRLGGVYYHATTLQMNLAVIFALAAGFLLRRTPIRGRRLAIRKEDLVIFGVLLLNPILLTLALLRDRVAFFYRYCITTDAAIYVAMALAISVLLRRNRLAGYTANSILLVFLTVNGTVFSLREKPRQEGGLSQYVPPNLPLVAASGLSFLEMNHNESPQLLSRLYYLSDRKSAVQYAHATLFEVEEPPAELKEKFGLRGNVEPYEEFVHQHQRFLVFGTYDWPEDWLLRKLKAEGADMKVIGHYNLSYKDKDLYLVEPRSAK